MELTRVDTVVQFTAGSATVWNNVNVPVPNGVVVIDTVNKIVKEGDGVTLFANLPICLDYNFNSSVSGAITPVGNDVGAIAIADDSTYSPSATKLTDLMSMISARNTVNTSQQTSIDQIGNNIYVASVLEGTPNGTIAICNGGKYAVGNKTLAQLISDLIVQSTVLGSSMHLVDLKWYADSKLTNPIETQNDIFEKSNYYCKVEGFHDNAEEKIIDFGLSTTQNGITITNSAKEETSALILATYGGTGSDGFASVAIDRNGDIIAVGYGTSSSFGGSTYGDAHIAKFDKDFNLLAHKRYGSTGDDVFIGVTVDSKNNIIAVGFTYSEGNGSADCLVVKFDNDLNLLGRKYYGGAAYDVYYDVAVDSNDNIICVGWSDSEGTGTSDAIVTKFDTNLNILVRKTYYSATSNEHFIGVTVDKNDNIICVGNTYSEGGGTTSGLIIKFDGNLNILARKWYGAPGETRFFTVAVDSNNNIFVSCGTSSEGIVSVIMKFDTNLNILARKKLSVDSTGSRLCIDSENNVIFVASQIKAGGSTHIFLVIKFNNDLGIIAKKQISGVGDDVAIIPTTDSNNNIYIAGYTSSEGAGSYDCFLVKLPSIMPSGTATGTVLTGLTISDSSVTVSDSALTLGNSALNITNCVLALSDSKIAIRNSDLTLEHDVITAARKTAPTKLLTSVYSSSGADQFNNLSKDASGNYYAVGYTNIGGVDTALIVKYDSSFNTVARKTVSGVYSSAFNSVHVDPNTDIVCVGWAKKLNGDPMSAFAIKFNKDLNTVIVQRLFTSTSNMVFLDSAALSNGNWYAVGYTEAEGSGLKEGFIVKFGIAFATAFKKRYGGTGNEVFTGVSINTAGFVFVSGYTTSEGPNTSGFILKYDISLNILLRKYYNSTLGTATVFNAIVTSDAGDSFLAGSVTIGGIKKGLIVKVDASLNVTGNKLYGNNIVSTEFTDIKLDTNSNIVVAGKTNAEGAGDYDALIVKMTQLFVILGRKTYGTFGGDGNTSCSIDSNNDINITGFINRSGSSDAIIAKIPSALPQGIYAGKVFTDLVFADSKLTLSDDSSTVNNSALTAGDIAVSATTGTATLAEATGGILSDAIILDAVGSVFRVNIGSVTGGNQSLPVTFNVSADDGKTVTTKSVGVNIQKNSILIATYGDTATVEQFTKAAIGIDGSIYAVGYKRASPTGDHNALIVKFDKNLNILAQKTYAGASHDAFNSIAYSRISDTIICSGATMSEGSGSYDALLVKFDTSLNILARKRYGGTGDEIFYDVDVDKFGWINCCGYTTSEGTGIPKSNAMVCRFDDSLIIYSRIIYGGTQSDIFSGIKSDSKGNIFCVGYANYIDGNTAPYSDALIVKFDANLTVLASKLYGNSNSNDAFNKVVIDSNDNVICSGWTGCEGPGSPTYANGLVVKFDNNLNILTRKYIGGISWDTFQNVTVDSKDNVICVGYGLSESAGGPNFGDSYVVKFDKNLNTLSKKRFGGTGDDLFESVLVDEFNNIIVTGLTSSEGAGNGDALIVKFPESIPSGTFVGTTFTALTISESNLTIADSNLTLADASLTLAVSAGTLGESTLTLANTSAILEKEVLNF